MKLNYRNERSSLDFFLLERDFEIGDESSMLVCVQLSENFAQLNVFYPWLLPLMDRVKDDLARI